MLKWQNEIIIHFVEGHPSSLNLMTFCQVLHGVYWQPCSFFQNLLDNEPDIDIVYSYAKDPYEVKYKFNWNMNIKIWI